MSGKGDGAVRGGTLAVADRQRRRRQGESLLCRRTATAAGGEDETGSLLEVWN